MKKLALAAFVAFTVLVSSAAHAETFAFADPARVDAESTEWQRLSAEVAADQAKKQREVDSAIAAANAAKPADARALGEKATALGKMDREDLASHWKSARAAFEKRRGEVAASLEREKHVTILLAPPAVPKPGRDLTDDLIKRLNASDAGALAIENARLKAENAALSRPAPPVVPAPPPIQPLAEKTRK